jgi:hypothetical protein
MRRLWEWWPFAALLAGGYILLPNPAPDAAPLAVGWRALAVGLLLLAVFGLLAWSGTLLQTGITWVASLATGNFAGANRVYYFLMRPGVLMHELAHAVAVLLVGGKITGFSAGETTKVSRTARWGPAALRQDVEPVRLGHVRYTVWGKSNLGLRLKDAFIGFAPLPVGIGLIAGMLALGHIDPAAGWEGLLQGRDWADWRLWVGLLVIFWVANQMMPSDVDRKNWPLAVFLLSGFTLIIVGALWAANQWLAVTPPGEWWEALIAAVSLLIAVLAVPVVLNTVVGLVLIGLFRLARR